MENRNQDLDKLKSQFNNALSNGDEEQLFHAFYAIEEIALARSDYVLLSGVYGLLTSFIYSKDKIDMLIRYSVQFLHYAKNIPELTEIEDYYGIAAILAFISEDYEQSMIYVKQEIEIHKKTNNQRAIASRMDNIAELQLLMGDVVEALNTVLDSRIILQELGIADKSWGMYNRGIIAKAYIKANDLVKAKEHLDEILRWQDLDDYVGLKQEVYTSLGRYHMAKDQVENGLDYLQEALEIAEANEFDQEKHILYLEVSKAYKRYGNYQESHKYLEKYSTYMIGAYKRLQTVLKLNSELEFALLEKEAEIKSLTTTSSHVDTNKNYDFRTGLYTESYMMTMMGQMLRRYKVTGNAFSLMILSIPHVREIELNQGMEAKEALLKAVAERLMSVKRTHHVLGRCSGDKIMVCMVDEELEQGKITAYRYLDELKNGGDTFEVFGGIVDNRHKGAIEITALYRMADLALYQSEKINDRQLTVW